MGARGFSLVETLVATAILVTGATSLAQLFVLATRANQIARSTTMETLLAQEKLEQLRVGSSLSSGGSLTGDQPGYSDIVDGYNRRWAIDPLAAGISSEFVVQVSVEGSLPGAVRFVDVVAR